METSASSNGHQPLSCNDPKKNNGLSLIAYDLSPTIHGIYDPSFTIIYSNWKVDGTVPTNIG